jgi:hypothetical protein
MMLKLYQHQRETYTDIQGAATFRDDAIQILTPVNIYDLYYYTKVHID